MLQIIKKFVNTFLGLFNLQLIKKEASGVVDKRSIISFQNENENYKLYFDT